MLDENILIVVVVTAVCDDSGGICRNEKVEFCVCIRPISVVV